MAHNYRDGCRCAQCRAAYIQTRAKWAASKRSRGFAGLRHGAVGTYRAGCRCDQCRSAATEAKRAWVQRQRQDGYAKLQHGTISTYNVGCRCEECGLAKLEAGRRARRRSRQPATVTAPPSDWEVFWAETLRKVGLDDTLERNVSSRSQEEDNEPDD